MRTVVVGVSTVVLLAALGAGCVELYRVHSALKVIRHQVAVEGDIPFTLTTLDDPGAPVGSSFERTAFEPVAFEPVATPNRFTTGSGFAGKLYLAGPGGIAIYNQPTATPRLLRTGHDLPPAAVTAFATGRLRGQATTSLLAATHGEGLLLFSASSAKATQLRPANAGDRDMTALLPLASGEVLIGTRNHGLLLYDGTKLRVFEPALANVAVTALAGDEGDFWVGTCNHGLLHWHAGELDTLDKPGNSTADASNLPDAQIEALAVAPQGVFAATPLGVAQIVDGHIARTLAPGLFAHAIAVDGNELLIATIDQGVHQVPLDAHADQRDDEHTAHTSTARHVTSFFTANDSLLAIAGDVVLRRAHAGWETVIAALPQALADTNVAALTLAPDGRLWIGYFDRGIDVLDLHTNQARHVEDDHIFCVNRIVTDAQRHTMDVATANGLVLFDQSAAIPKVRQVISRRDGLISDQITDIAFTNTGLALATPAGLTFLTPSGPDSLYTFQGLANNHVYALAADPSNGRVIAGTLGGVSMLSDATVRRNVTLRNSALKRNWITAVVRIPQPDNAGMWFLGTYGGGLVQMDANGSITPMGQPAPDAVINPNAILRTATHIYAGSLDDGLLVYDLATHHWSQIVAGLPSRNVTAFTAAGGELYIGTENGIVRTAEAALP